VLPIIITVEAPYVVHTLPSQIVFDFLSKRQNKLCHFVSDIMDYLWACVGQQQTNQRNDQADCLP